MDKFGQHGALQDALRAQTLGSGKFGMGNFVPVTRQIIAGAGLEGGGALSADVTLGLGGDSLLLYDAALDPIREYAATPAGLAAALAVPPAGGDTLQLPSTTISGNYIIPAYVNVNGLGQGSVLSGTIVSESGFLTNLRAGGYYFVRGITVNPSGTPATGSTLACGPGGGWVINWTKEYAATALTIGNSMSVVGSTEHYTRLTPECVELHATMAAANNAAIRWYHFIVDTANYEYWRQYVGGTAGPDTNMYLDFNPTATTYRYTFSNTGAFTARKIGAAGIAIDPNEATGNFVGSLSPANLTANRRWTFPDADLTISAAAGGTGTSGQVAQWGAGNTLTSANLIAPANLLTLIAAGAYSLTVPATGTAALLAIANTFTATQTIQIGASAQALIITGWDATHTAPILMRTSDSTFCFGVNNLGTPYTANNVSFASYDTAGTIRALLRASAADVAEIGAKGGLLTTQIFAGTATAAMTLTGGNVGVGITAFGTSAAKVLGIGSGTAPTTAPADMAQMWVQDINAAAGYAGFHKRTETTNVIEIIPGVVIKATTGRTANPYEGFMEINTFDNLVAIYADAGWRTITSGW